MHAVESGEGRIDPHEFHGDEADENRPPGAADAEVTDVEFLQRLDQLEGEGVADPIIVDDRRDLRFRERADLVEDRQFVGAQGFPDAVKVAVWRRQLGRGPGDFGWCVHVRLSV